MHVWRTVAVPHAWQYIKLCSCACTFIQQMVVITMWCFAGPVVVHTWRPCMSVAAITSSGYSLLRLPGLPPHHVFEAFLMVQKQIHAGRGIAICCELLSSANRVCVCACVSLCVCICQLAYANIHMWQPPAHSLSCQCRLSNLY